MNIVARYSSSTVYSILVECTVLATNLGEFLSFHIFLAGPAWEISVAVVVVH